MLQKHMILQNSVGNHAAKIRWFAATTAFFLFCCAAFLHTEIKTRPQRAQTVISACSYARKIYEKLPIDCGKPEDFCGSLPTIVL